jgi:ABC-type oligopeptide transport system substrate-binding subunit
MSARNSMNLKFREKAYADAHNILLEEETVILPLYYEPNIALVRPSCKGFELNPLNYMLLKNVNIQ